MASQSVRSRSSGTKLKPERSSLGPSLIFNIGQEHRTYLKNREARSRSLQTSFACETGLSHMSTSHQEMEQSRKLGSIGRRDQHRRGLEQGMEFVPHCTVLDTRTACTEH